MDWTAVLTNLKSGAPLGSAIMSGVFGSHPATQTGDAQAQPSHTNPTPVTNTGVPAGQYQNALAGQSPFQTGQQQGQAAVAAAQTMGQPAAAGGTASYQPQQMPNSTPQPQPHKSHGAFGNILMALGG